MIDYSWLLNVETWSDPWRNVFFPNLLPLVSDLHNNFWIKIIGDTTTGLFDTTLYAWTDINHVKIKDNYNDNIMQSLNYYLDNYDELNKISNREQSLLDNSLDIYLLNSDFTFKNYGKDHTIFDVKIKLSRHNEIYVKSYILGSFIEHKTIYACQHSALSYLNNCKVNSLIDQYWYIDFSKNYELISYKYSSVMDHILKRRLSLIYYYPILLDNYINYLPLYNDIVDLATIKWDDYDYYDYEGPEGPLDEFRYEFLSRHYTDEKNYIYDYLPPKSLEHHDFVQGQCTTNTIYWLRNNNDWVNHPCGLYFLIYEKWGLMDGILKFWHGWFHLSFYPSWTYYYWGLPSEPNIQIHPCDTFLPSFWDKGYAGYIQDFFTIQDLEEELNFYNRHFVDKGYLSEIYIEKQFKNKIWDEVTHKWVWPKSNN